MMEFSARAGAESKGVVAGAGSGRPRRIALTPGVRGIDWRAERGFSRYRSEGLARRLISTGVSLRLRVRQFASSQESPPSGIALGKRHDSEPRISAHYRKENHAIGSQAPFPALRGIRVVASQLESEC